MAIRIIPRGNGIYLDRETADKLCALPNKDAVRLYLYLAVHPESDESHAARALALAPQMLAEAREALCRARLISTEETAGSDVQLNEQRRQSMTEPQYSPEEVMGLVTSDIAFAQVVREAETVLHPCLGESDLRELMTIYRYFGMPAECMILLLHFARARTARQNGRRPSLAMIKKEAYRWLENGITTPEAAERFIADENRIYETVERIEQAIGLRVSRQDERRLLRSWAEMGFDADAAALAREITVKRLGEMELKYAGSILKSWKSAGLTTAEAIKAFEARREKEHEEARAAHEKRTSARRVPQASGSFSEAELDAIRQMQAYMNDNHGGNEQ